MGWESLIAGRSKRPFSEATVRSTARRIMSARFVDVGQTVSRPCHSRSVMRVPDRTVQDRPFPNGCENKVAVVFSVLLDRQESKR